MQFCCQAKVQALKGNDKGLADKWGQEELKAFDAMLDLQRQLPPSNQPPVATVAGATPKPAGSTQAIAQRSGGAKPASTKKVKGWLTTSSKTLEEQKKKTSQNDATRPPCALQ
jgi:hypothetical protein